MLRQSSRILSGSHALLLAAASVLLASACGGGGSGGGGSGFGGVGGGSGTDTVQLTPVPSLEASLNAAGIERIPRQLDNDGDPIMDFQPDPTARVAGRLELVAELERCLQAGECDIRLAVPWLVMGEYDGSQASRHHRQAVSIAMQAGAGAIQPNSNRLAFEDIIRSINARDVAAINLVMQRTDTAPDTIPDGAWVNWSRPSHFGFNIAALHTSSVVVAIAAGNDGASQPYTQRYATGNELLSQEPNYNKAYLDLSRAIRNTSVIFVYGLNDAATDIHPSSSHCGERVMFACIGVAYSFDFTPFSRTSFSALAASSGTSFSTALLSGIAWAMKARWNDLTAQQIAVIMLASARPLHDGDAPADVRTGVGALDLTKLFEPVGPMTAKELGSDDLVLERGFLHLPGLTDFDNPQAVDSFARNFQLVTSSVSIQPDFSDFDLDRFTPAAPGSRLHLAVRKRTGGAEDAALAFGHTNKIVLSSRYLGLCRDGQNTDLCLTTTRREDFFGGQGSGSFRLEDTTYTSFAATHQMPIRDRLKLGFSAAVTEARTSGKHLVGDVEGRLLQAEFSLRSDKDTRSRKTSTSLSIWGSKFDGSMDMRGKQSPLHERSAGVRLRWKLDF